MLYTVNFPHALKISSEIASYHNGFGVVGFIVMANLETEFCIMHGSGSARANEGEH